MLSGVLLLTLPGCNCFGREFTETFTYNVHAESTDPLCAKQQYEVNLGEDEGFKKVKQFVTRVDVRKLEVAVKDPKTREDSAATKAGGSVSVSDSESGTLFTLGTYGDVPIEAGSRQEIAVDATAEKELSRLIRTAPNTFWATAEGCNDAVPAFYDFDVLLTLYVGL
jgi:hypothetical protein